MTVQVPRIGKKVYITSITTPWLYLKITNIFTGFVKELGGWFVELENKYKAFIVIDSVGEFQLSYVHRNTWRKYVRRVKSTN